MRMRMRKRLNIVYMASHNHSKHTTIPAQTLLVQQEALPVHVDNRKLSVSGKPRSWSRLSARHFMTLDDACDMVIQLQTTQKESRRTINQRFG